MTDGLDERARIRQRAFELGFDAVGFASASLGPTARSRLREFLEAGYHGDMGWLENKADVRGNPQTLWPDARTVIVVGLSYAPANDPLEVLSLPSQGAISVYAGNRDYHDIVKGKLKHLGQFIASRFCCEFKVFVDTAPVMEKPLAQKSGLGWQGKHTNLVSRSFGSWLFLGEIFMSLELEPDAPGIDHCGQCTRCLSICPTQAFPKPYQIDATRCISYLTIEHQGPIPRELRPMMGNRIYGCDDCLSVCPWNKFALPASNQQLIVRDDLKAAQLVQFAGLDDKDFRTVFSGSPIKRIGRNRFVRNVLMAVGNSKLPSLRPSAERLLNDPDPVVAEAAQWACGRLDTNA